jgi:hypothetical protein
MPWPVWNPEVETYSDYLNRTHNDPSLGVFQLGVPETAALPVDTAPLPVLDLPTPPPAAAAPTPTDIPTDADGKAIFTQSLVGRGFTPQAAASLADGLWTRSKTLSEAELWIELRKTPEYTERFGGLVNLRDRVSRGEFIAHIPSESEYLDIEKQMSSSLRNAGLPPSFYDSPSDFAKFIENDVSAAELDARVDAGLRAAISLPPELRAQLGQEFLGTGDIAAYFLDPTAADDILTRNRTLLEIGAAGITSGYRVSRGEAERIQNFGATAAQAGAGFTELGLQAPLFANTAEESGEITREEQIAAQFGNSAEAQSEIQRRRAARQARFGGGGGAAGVGGRGSGLGTAQ